MLCSDLDLALLSLEFKDLIGSSNIEDLRKLSLSDLVKRLASLPGMFENVKIAMARVVAAKPHSCDVERLVSACNLMKTATRSFLDISTENLHLSGADLREC